MMNEQQIGRKRRGPSSPRHGIETTVWGIRPPVALRLHVADSHDSRRLSDQGRSNGLSPKHLIAQPDDRIARKFG